MLKPGGRFIILGPNIKYAYKEYWAFYDHYLELSHISLAEGLRMNGYEIAFNVARFLPFTMANKQPTHDIFINICLAHLRKAVSCNCREAAMIIAIQLTRATASKKASICSSLNPIAAKPAAILVPSGRTCRCNHKRSGPDLICVAIHQPT